MKPTQLIGMSAAQVQARGRRPSLRPVLGRFSTLAVVYGHLHIRCSTVHDGVRFEEVSLVYRREWTPRGLPRPVLRPILPAQEVE
jgi:hypothetical protein